MDQEGEVEGSSINISDVMEVIQTDPEFGSEMMDRGRRLEGPAPSVRIIEQPASKALRFRYECEGRSAGSIPGVNSTPENKTFPSIKIDNYQGRAMVLVSCVTKDPPYRAHPHNLVGKERCKKGVCTVEVDTETMMATFSNLGIQCVKKKDIEQALIERENLRIDPFKNGFSHKTQSGMIDLNAVRLCFQVFLEGPGRNEFKRPIHPPIVSEPIYDKKAMSDLVICKLSDCAASVAGGKEMILLCEKVAKEDINVRLYEEKDGNIIWEGWGDFTPTQVHKQVAIWFRTPRYKTLEIDYPVQVFIQLYRPSDKATSAPLPFQLTPLDADMKRKRQRRVSSNPSQEYADKFRQMQETEQMLRMQKSAIKPDISQIKLEPTFPAQLSPIHHSPVASPPYGGPSGGYQPPVYQPPATTVIPNYDMIYVHSTANSPLQPVQQVDVAMTPMEINPLLHQLQPNRISPQSVLQQSMNDLNTPQMSGISLQNVLQPTNDLNSPVQMNQLSPQPHNMMPPQPRQPVHNQENDELNTPTVSATGLDEQNNVHGNAFGDDRHNMAQLTSGDIACILGGMETGSLSQNLSNLSFE